MSAKAKASIAVLVAAGVVGLGSVAAPVASAGSARVIRAQFVPYAIYALVREEDQFCVQVMSPERVRVTFSSRYKPSRPELKRMAREGLPTPFKTYHLRTYTTTGIRVVPCAEIAEPRHPVKRQVVYARITDLKTGRRRTIRTKPYRVRRITPTGCGPNPAPPVTKPQLAIAACA